MCLFVRSIDATHNLGRLGKYVNDAKEGTRDCNANMKRITPTNNYPRLVLFASRDIEAGEEISYDYEPGGKGKDFWWRHPRPEVGLFLFS